MKKLLLASLLILGANVTYAQSTQNRSTAQSNVKMSVQVPGASDRANVQTERMAKELGLNAEQKAKILEVNTHVETQLENIRQAGPSASPERNNVTIQHRDEKYKSILTAEQYSRYESSRAKTAAPVSK